MKMMKSLLLAALLLAGCSSAEPEPEAEPIALSTNGGYFDVTQNELVKKLKTELSAYNPEIITEDGKDYIKFTDKTGAEWSCYVSNNAVNKVETVMFVSSNYPKPETQAELDELAQTWFIETPTDVLSAFDVENPEGLAEAAYMAMQEATESYKIGSYSYGGYELMDAMGVTDGTMTLSFDIEPAAE